MSSKSITTLLIAGLLMMAGDLLFAEPTTTVSPSVTTSPTGSPLSAAGNADDPAIWIHPTNPEKSVIIGTDKDEGLWVWDLSGKKLQQVPLGTAVNNVDLRYSFKLGGGEVDIVAANLRKIGKVAVFRINPDYTGSDILITLADKDSKNNDIQKDSYAFALYRRPSDGNMYLFDRAKKKKGGALRQFLIEDDGSGKGVKVTPVRDLNYSGKVNEGTVADDELGFLYTAEEGKGIHKYYADPDKSGDPISLFALDDGITSDREGLALYKCADGTGYLLLSDQGDSGMKVPSSVKIYERQGDNKFVKTVFTTDSRGRGDQQETDGLDVTSVSLPPLFPQGFVITHDGFHSAFNLYKWEDFAQDDLATCSSGVR